MILLENGLCQNQPMQFIVPICQFRLWFRHNIWAQNFNKSYQGTKIQSDNYQKIYEHPETDPKTERQEIQAMISEIMDS